MSPTRDQSDSDEFKEYKRLILVSLQDLKESQKELREQHAAAFGTLHQELAQLQVQVGQLKVRAGFYGLVMGGLGAVLVALAKVYL